ncbi:MAG: nucleotidyltransferase domain-containing protein [Geminicoccaceae bacterium]
MTEAIARPGPQIDHPRELDRIVKQIVAKADPMAIYLFGSRARGDARDDSDYDLMIVVPDDFPASKRNSATAYALVEGRRIPIDVAIVSEARFRERSEKVGTLSFEVGQDGVRLYERRHRS